MSTRTSRRRLAVKQRQTLKALGYDDHDIETFAQIFDTTTAEPAGLGCAADQTVAGAGTNRRSTR